MKKLIPFLLVFSLLLITACGEETTSTPDASSTPTATPEAPAPEPEPAPAPPADLSQPQPLPKSAPPGITAKTNYNILDYYLLLPPDYFFCDADASKDSKAFRMSVLKKKNTKGGYILAEPQGFQLQLALFKDRTNNRDVIGLSMICGMGCMCNFMEFYLLEGETWTPITTEILPDAAEGFFVLPEKGTTVRVYDYEFWESIPADVALAENEKDAVFLLDWKDGMFTIRK